MTDTRFGEALKRLRLDHARDLLADPANAGLRVTDVSHFTRRLRARGGWPNGAPPYAATP